jgi:hypothetical protein
MNWNNLNPNEKLALILINSKNIRRMRDDMIAILVFIMVSSLCLIGLAFALYEIKTQLGIDIFP